uniref:Uncharacterized protein n=1 Tax=Moniliophthora roreri TaxID=221103 RepID=A0A0W0FHR1_MONRR
MPQTYSTSTSTRGHRERSWPMVEEEEEEEEEISEADDSIVLMTGEASRLRRRGAIRGDHSHPPQRQATPHLEQRRKTYYRLRCNGGQPSPCPIESQWSDQPFEPSLFPLPGPPKPSSPKKKRKRDSACGELLHPSSQCTQRQNSTTYTAHSSGVCDVVVPIDASYFRDRYPSFVSSPNSSEPSLLQGRISRRRSSYASSSIERDVWDSEDQEGRGAELARNACGGTPLGTRFKPCAAARMSIRRFSTTHPHLSLHFPGPLFSPIQSPILPRQASTSYMRTRDNQDHSETQSRLASWRSPSQFQVGRGTLVPRVSSNQSHENRDDIWIYTFFSDAVEAVELEADANVTVEDDLDIPEHLDPADLENTPVIPPTPPEVLSGWAFEGVGPHSYMEPPRFLPPLSRRSNTMGVSSNLASVSNSAPMRSNSTPAPRRPRRQNRIGSGEVEESLARESPTRSITMGFPSMIGDEAQRNRVMQNREDNRLQPQQLGRRRGEHVSTGQRLHESSSSASRTRQDRAIQYREMDELITRMMNSTESLRLNLSRASRAESDSGPSIWSDSSSGNGDRLEGEAEFQDVDMELLTIPWFGIPEAPADAQARPSSSAVNEGDTDRLSPSLQEVLNTSDESQIDLSDDDDDNIGTRNRSFIPHDMPGFRAVSDVDDISGDDSESDESEDDEVRPTVWSELYPGEEGYFVVPGDRDDSSSSSSSSSEHVTPTYPPEIRMGTMNALRRYTLPQPPAMTRTAATRPREVLFDPDGEFLENAREEWDDGDKDEEEEEQERRIRWPLFAR